MIKNWWIILLLFCYSNTTLGQEPFSFILGEKELSAVDIYDIKQTPDGVYWIASNNGLMSYNGYEFTKYSHSEMRSSSLFNLQVNYDGIIHCNNLNGQIFNVIDGNMNLIHEVEDSLLTPFISYNFLPNNDMVIHSRDCYKVSNGVITKLISFCKGHCFESAISRTPEGKLLLQFERGTLYTISENEVKKTKLNFIGETGPDLAKALTFYYHNGKLYANGNGNELLHIIDSTESVISMKKLFVTENVVSRLYHNSMGLWVANNMYGIKLINSQIELIRSVDEGENLLFKNYFASNSYEDLYGNIMIGTFGDGIIVIPNTGVTNISLGEDTKISRICSDGKQTLFIGGFNGSVFSYKNGQIDTIYKNGSKMIEFLEWLELEKSVLFDQDVAKLVNLEDMSVTSKRYGAMKGLSRMQGNIFVMATNVGAYQVNVSPDISDTNQKLFPGRTYDVHYTPQTQDLLIASSKGLIHQKHLNVNINEEILYQGNSLLVKGFAQFQRRVFLGTKQYGLLEWDNGKLIPFIDESNGLLSNNITKVEVHKSWILIASDNGFQVFNLSGELVKTLSYSDGLSNNKITDFAVDEKLLWLLHQNGLQHVNLSSLEQEEYVTTLQSVEILNNNSKVNLSDNFEFDYDQNKFLFRILAPSLERQEDITYEYRLSGIDEKWNIRPYDRNEIEYKSLPPGNYTFEVILKYKGKVQDSYKEKFTIDSPYWQKWWFFLIIILGLVIVMYLFYRRRLKSQEAKAKQVNELNASKLTAIQSQMNPHFIFNSLNSIQGLVLKGDIDNSYTYITKFADLVRRTLNYSDKDFIDFEQEIKLLELYLSLEKLRFKKDFEFKIINHGVEDIKVPPMLIQPFIENALVHGLLHKSGNKEIVIEFELNDCLNCTITDNGVGRDMAREIKQRKKTEYESFSVNAIKKRFEILEEHFGGELGFEYYDMMEGNEPSGTKVVMKIPVRRSY